MNAPTSDDNSEDRLRYLPWWARERPRNPDEGGSSPEPGQEPEEERNPSAPERARDLDDPRLLPLLLATSPSTIPPDAERLPARVLSGNPEFGGDIAVRQLRTRLTLDPSAVPEPPIERTGSLLRIIGRLVGLMLIAAACAFALVMLAFPGAQTPAPSEPGSRGPALASTRSDRVAIESLRAARLLVVQYRRLAANEQAPLSIVATNAPKDGTILLGGLPAGSRVSVGEAVGESGWRIPLRDLGAAVLVPPPGFVGAMDLAVDLRGADGAIADSNVMHMEWAAPPRPAAPPPPDTSVAIGADEIAFLMRRGQDFVATGDFASARLVFRRAAEAGDANAALQLGATYDPAFLRQLGAVGAAPDPAQARAWYRRAADLGSTEAAGRIARLER